MTADPPRSRALFRDIPETIRARMAYLEQVDALDRQDGTPRQHRLRQIKAALARGTFRLAGVEDAVTLVIVPVGKGQLVCRRR